jgi:hypothetical protein
MEKKPVPKVATLDDLVKELHKAFEGDKDADVDYVRAIFWRRTRATHVTGRNTSSSTRTSK